jgi:hypothetical protein
MYNKWTDRMGKYKIKEQCRGEFTGLEIER